MLGGRLAVLPLSECIMSRPFTQLRASFYYRARGALPLLGLAVSACSAGGIEGERVTSVTVPLSTSRTPVRLHRMALSCDGKSLGPKQSIDLSGGYKAFTCGNRFQEQCVDDGTPDAYYMEWCDYAGPTCSPTPNGTLQCDPGASPPDGAQAVVLHRTVRSCRGDAVGDEQVIDLRSGEYSNYTCQNNFERQCVTDGSWDRYTEEWCEYQTPKLAAQKINESLGLRDLESVAENPDFSLKIGPDGWVSGTGINSSGQLGLGSASYVDTMTRVPLPEPAKRIAAGPDFALSIGKSGVIYAWGASANGELASVRTTPAVSPFVLARGVWIDIAVSYRTVFALDSLGRLFTWGQGRPEYGEAADAVVSFHRVLGVPEFARVFAGNSSIALVDRTGALWTWGSNGSGQLGLGDFATRSAPTKTSLSDVVSAAVGHDWVLAATRSGMVYAFGNNATGAVLPGSASPTVVAPTVVPGLPPAARVFVSGSASAMEATNGATQFWGNDAPSSASPPPSAPPPTSAPPALAPFDQRFGLYAPSRYAALPFRTHFGYTSWKSHLPAVSGRPDLASFNSFITVGKLDSDPQSPLGRFQDPMGYPDIPKMARCWGRLAHTAGDIPQLQSERGARASVCKRWYCAPLNWVGTVGKAIRDCRDWVMIDPFCATGLEAKAWNALRELYVDEMAACGFAAETDSKESLLLAHAESLRPRIREDAKAWLADYINQHPITPTADAMRNGVKVPITFEVGGNEPNLFPYIPPKVFAKYYLTLRKIILEELSPIKWQMIPVYSRALDAHVMIQPIWEADLMPAGLWVTSSRALDRRGVIYGLFETGLNAFRIPKNHVLDAGSYYDEFVAALRSADNLSLNGGRYAQQPVGRGGYIKVYQPPALSSLVNTGNIHFYPAYNDEGVTPNFTDLAQISPPVSQEYAKLDAMVARVTQNTSSGKVMLTEFGNATVFHVTNPAADLRLTVDAMSRLIDHLKADPRIRAWYYFQSNQDDSKLRPVDVLLKGRGRGLFQLLTGISGAFSVRPIQGFLDLSGNPRWLLIDMYLRKSRETPTVFSVPSNGGGTSGCIAMGTCI
jgi:hypothetical protein